MASFSSFKSNIITASNTAAGVETSAGVTIYATRANLPTSGNEAGDQAYVTGNNRLYIWNGSGWYNVALLNVAPAIQSVLDSDGTSTPFQLSSEGATTTITITAVDSDGDPVTYAATSDSDFAGLATLSQADNVFTITPFSQDSATTESGTITFTATDGVNVASSGVQTFTLLFLSSYWKDVAVSIGTLSTGGLDNSTFVDRSTNAETVTTSGSPIQTAFHPYLDNWSVKFSTDRVDMSSVLVGPTTSTFTVECWVNLSSLPTVSAGTSLQPQGTVTLDGIPGANTNYHTFGVNTNGSIGLRWFDGSAKKADGTTILDIGKWYHIACVVSSNSIQLYVDGVAESMSGTTTLTNRNGTTGQSAFGSNYWTTFNGYIFNLRVTHSVVYTSAFTPSTENLAEVAGTQLLTCQSNRFIDNSTSNRTLTIVNNPEVSAYNPFGQGSEYATGKNKGSMYVEGASYLESSANSSFQFGTGDFTIEFWFHPKTFSNYNTPIDMGYTNSGSYVLQNGSGGFPYFYTNSSATVFTSATAYTLNSWNHLVVSRSGSTLSMFLNGTRTNTATNSDNLNANYPLGIGGSPTHSEPHQIDGYLSDVRLVKGTAVYDPSQTSLTVPTAPVGNTNASIYLQMDNAGIFDKTGNSIIKLSGDTATSTTYTKHATTSVFTDTGGMLINNVESPSSNDFTYEGWFYPTEVPGSGNAFISHGWGGYGAFVFYSSNTQYSLYMSSTGSGWDVVSGENINVTPWTGSWKHFAFTRSGNTIRVFLDGTQTYTKTISGSLASLTAGTDDIVGVGSAINGTSGVHGAMYVENFQILKGVAKYTANFTPPTSTQGRTYQAES